MATTAQKSDFQTNVDATPRVMNKRGGILKCQHVKHTQSGAGDATSTIDLWTIPGGATLLTQLSSIRHTDFGTGVTLDIGWTAYTKPDGTSATADPDGLVEDIDVSTAASLGKPLSNGTAIGAAGYYKEFEGPALIQATVVGGAIPDGAVVECVFVYI
jgi:hypothetical protein